VYILILVLGYELRASIADGVGAVVEIQIILRLITLGDPTSRV